MSSIIDNKEKIFLKELKEAFKKTESFDCLTAYFYFSGFNELAKELKDKKIRILVGKCLDPKLINRFNADIKLGKRLKLSEEYSYRDSEISGLSRHQIREIYIDSFVKIFNESYFANEFDIKETQEAFSIFREKLNDGTLEIRFTKEPNHGKLYVLTYKNEYSMIQKGKVFMGSANLTFNGLFAQGELLESFDDDNKYNEYSNKFEPLWEEASTLIDADNFDEFNNKVKNELWLNACPKPYDIYIRILYELYNNIDNIKIKTPSSITNGTYDNYQYQLDAIKQGIDCINKHSGVIIADVVGLGKSIIAAAIAKNIIESDNIYTVVVIAPPHLRDQWEDYMDDFHLNGRVYSSGKIEEPWNKYKDGKMELIMIIDEAHRYRNENTQDYAYLHQLSRSNYKNKVILLTATPYNNRPQDVFSLVKLFQTPAKSSLNTVANLGAKFDLLRIEYYYIYKDSKIIMTAENKERLENLAKEIRLMIEPVVIRRSRLDLKQIKKYDEDLLSQGITFPKVCDPEIIEYDLGYIREDYIETLNRLEEQFKATRYNPAEFLIDSVAFQKKYKDFFNEAEFQYFQKELAKMIKRLLVMRFESSLVSFESTLDNLIESYEKVINWWNEGYVPIRRKSGLMDPNEMDESDLEELIEEIDKIVNNMKSFTAEDIARIKDKVVPVDRNFFSDEYLEAVKEDLKLLKEIKDSWFNPSKGIVYNNKTLKQNSYPIKFDPKLLKVKEQINQLLKDNPLRKIVIFTFYADTAKYVFEQLKIANYRTFCYTGGSSKTARQIVKENFDASSKQQKNDYDIIVATDALSEGFNLNRAGVVINYDIPYNPTRVIQRIGRINRINKTMFNEIYIYNLFPTDIGEAVTNTKGITTLKMLLINNVVGSDTKTLTADEDLKSYFKKQYEELAANESEISWDNQYINDYTKIKDNHKLIEKAKAIPSRSRIIRDSDKNSLAIMYAKRGDQSLFVVLKEGEETAEVCPPELALEYFKATREEEATSFDQILEEKFEILKDELLKPDIKTKASKQDKKVFEKLELLKTYSPKDRDYICDLRDTLTDYDDLVDEEVKFINNIKVDKTNYIKVISDLKEHIPQSYLDGIISKAKNTNIEPEIVMYVEDIRRKL